MHACMDAWMHKNPSIQTDGPLVGADDLRPEPGFPEPEEEELREFLRPVSLPPALLPESRVRVHLRLESTE